MLNNGNAAMLFFFGVVAVAGVTVALDRIAPKFGELAGKQNRQLVILFHVAVVKG